MRRLWLQTRRIAALLLATLAIGHAQIASACLTAATFCDPCCQMTSGHSPCAKDCPNSTDCVTGAQCTCAQPAHIAEVSALDSRDHAPQAPPLVWVASLVTNHLIPPPQGLPPAPLIAPLGRHTYLATLRLRI